MEIFRDDVKKVKTVSLYKEDFPLDKLEHYIALFHKEIPTDFMKV